MGRDLHARRCGHRRACPGPARVALVYHGLDLGRFPAPPEPPGADGGDPADPVLILSVGRAVAKKGYDDLLDALAVLPPDLHWRFAHVGGGELAERLKRRGVAGLGGIDAFLGGQAQPESSPPARGRLFVLPAPRARAIATACRT